MDSLCDLLLHQGAKIGFTERSEKAEFYLGFMEKMRQNGILRKGG